MPSETLFLLGCIAFGLIVLGLLPPPSRPETWDDAAVRRVLRDLAKHNATDGSSAMMIENDAKRLLAECGYRGEVKE